MIILLMAREAVMIPRKRLSVKLPSFPKCGLSLLLMSLLPSRTLLSPRDLVLNRIRSKYGLRIIHTMIHTSQK